VVDLVEKGLWLRGGWDGGEAWEGEGWGVDGWGVGVGMGERKGRGEDEVAAGSGSLWGCQIVFKVKSPRGRGGMVPRSKTR